MKPTSITGVAEHSVRGMRLALCVLALAAAVVAPRAQAAPVNVTLCAQPFTQAVTPSASVPMWGYSLGACGAPSAPGPLLTLAPGDGPLVVTLINNLPVPTSIVLAGQNLPAGSAPVYATDVQDAGGPTVCTPSQADTACRIRSFTNETPSGGTQTYTFDNLRPGTYLYQSGTHPQVQVQMGLFGMAKQDAAPGQLFIGRSYAIDVPVVLSEIDPDLHNTIAATLGTPGSQAAWKAGNNSTLNYAPKYFLINGKVFDGTAANDLPVSTFNGANVVLRLANAGLQSRSLMLNGGHWSLLTEDGYPYPAPREQYSALLPAGKTTDALIVASVPATGTNSSLAIFDRRGGTHNADGGALGGQVARLAMSNSGPAPNQPPSVNAGPDQTIPNTAASVNLIGSVTDDGVSLPLSVAWSVVSGPGSVTFGSPGAASSSASFSALGRYTLRLTASDPQYTASDDVVVNVNSPPSVNAGVDQTVTVANATLSGTASDDGAVLPLTTAWSLVSGPGTVTLSNASGLSTAAAFAALGTYTMRLTANDGQFSVADDMLVTITASKHIADLDRSSTAGLLGWVATVTVRVENALHQPVNGVTVSGTWSGGGIGGTGCITNALLGNPAGTCTMIRLAIPNTQASNTFTVSNATGAAAEGPYLSANNHDPDSGAQASNGTTIVVPRP